MTEHDDRPTDPTGLEPIVMTIVQQADHLRGVVRGLKVDAKRFVQRLDEVESELDSLILLNQSIHPSGG